MTTTDPTIIALVLGGFLLIVSFVVFRFVTMLIDWGKPSKRELDPPDTLPWHSDSTTEARYKSFSKRERALWFRRQRLIAPLVIILFLVGAAVTILRGHAFLMLPFAAIIAALIMWAMWSRPTN